MHLGEAGEKFRMRMLCALINKRKANKIVINCLINSEWAGIVCRRVFLPAHLVRNFFYARLLLLLYHTRRSIEAVGDFAETITII